MKIIAIIQARMSSTRFPGKVLKQISGKTILERVIEQGKKIQYCDTVIVATSTDPSDDIIEKYCTENGFDFYRGDLMDVRSRFLEIGEKYNADLIIRLTADNPLTHPEYADILVEKIKGDDSVAYGRMSPSAIPYGAGSEVFRFNKLVEYAPKFADDHSKEHVTPALVKNTKIHDESESGLLLGPPHNLSVTVDTPEDYEFMKRLIAHYNDTDVLVQAVRDIKNGSFSI